MCKDTHTPTPTNIHTLTCTHTHTSLDINMCAIYQHKHMHVHTHTRICTPLPPSLLEPHTHTHRPFKRTQAPHRQTQTQDNTKTPLYLQQSNSPRHMPNASDDTPCWKHRTPPPPPPASTPHTCPLSPLTHTQAPHRQTQTQDTTQKPLCIYSSPTHPDTCPMPVMILPAGNTPTPLPPHPPLPPP